MDTELKNIIYTDIVWFGVSHNITQCQLTRFEKQLMREEEEQQQQQRAKHNHAAHHVKALFFIRHWIENHHLCWRCVLWCVSPYHTMSTHMVWKTKGIIGLCYDQSKNPQLFLIYIVYSGAIFNPYLIKLWITYCNPNSMKFNFHFIHFHTLKQLYYFLVIVF